MNTQRPNRPSRDKPNQNAIQILAIGGLSLIAGLFPTLTPWIGTLFALGLLTNNTQLKNPFHTGLTTTLTLFLLQKTATIGEIQETPLFNPTTLFLAIWALQFLRAQKNRQLTDWSSPLLKSPTWLLLLFCSASALLQALRANPWDPPLEPKAYSIALGIALILTAKNKETLLQSLTFACLWSLLSNPEAIEKIFTALGLVNQSPPSIWKNLYFPAKNSGAALTTLCIGILLAKPTPKRLITALILSGLILLQNSVGSTLILATTWAIYLAWKPIKTLWQIKKGGRTLAITSLVLLFLTGGALSAWHAKTQHKDFRASGRIPSSLHLLQSWVTQNPAYGVDPFFRETTPLITQQKTIPKPPNSGTTNALYLISLTRHPSCNNVFIESLVQFGIPLTLLLATYLLLLLLKTPLNPQQKTLIALPLFLTLNYTSMGPFGWGELGILWILGAILTPTYQPKETPKALRGHPQIGNHFLQSYKHVLKQKKTPILLASLTGVCLAAPTLPLQKQWVEIWKTPNQPTLTQPTASLLPQNTGTKLPAEILKQTAKKNSLGIKITRPYLTNTLIVKSPNKKQTQREKEILFEETKIPITAIKSYWKTPNFLTPALLALTPFALLALLKLNENPSCQAKTFITLLCLNLIIVLPFLQQNKTKYRLYTIKIPPTPHKKENNPWQTIWMREINKTSLGEMLKILLQQEGFPAEFSFTKPPKEKTNERKRTRTTTSSLTLTTTAPKKTVESVLKTASDNQTTYKIQKAVDINPKTKKKTP